jgi:hypothetical protein
LEEIGEKSYQFWKGANAVYDSVFGTPAIEWVRWRTQWVAEKVRMQISFSDSHRVPLLESFNCRVSVRSRISPSPEFLGDLLKHKKITLWFCDD